MNNARSSINPHFTFLYSQPNEYRFSHDSVFLARWVYEFLSASDLSTKRGLDLCAGCGIVGLDFLFHLFKENQKIVKSFDFLEVQDVYREHFNRNLKNLGNSMIPMEFKQANYADLSGLDFKDRYDLILSNPPYFQLGHGRLSPSKFKNRCRFFMDSDFSHLIRGIENALASQGQAFILLKRLSAHGFDYIKEAEQLLSPAVTLINRGTIRGTDLVQLIKS